MGTELEGVGWEPGRKNQRQGGAEGTLAGVVDRVLFERPETGYRVLQV